LSATLCPLVFLVFIFIQLLQLALKHTFPKKKTKNYNKKTTAQQNTMQNTIAHIKGNASIQTNEQITHLSYVESSARDDMNESSTKELQYST